MFDELIMDHDDHRYIVHNGNPVEIYWPKVVFMGTNLLDYLVKKGSYKDMSGKNR